MRFRNIERYECTLYAYRHERKFPCSNQLDLFCKMWKPYEILFESERVHIQCVLLYGQPFENVHIKIICNWYWDQFTQLTWWHARAIINIYIVKCEMSNAKIDISHYFVDNFRMCAYKWNVKSQCWQIDISHYFVNDVDVLFIYIYILMWNATFHRTFRGRKLQ